MIGKELKSYLMLLSGQRFFLIFLLGMFVCSCSTQVMNREDGIEILPPLNASKGEIEKHNNTPAESKEIEPLPKDIWLWRPIF